MKILKTHAEYQAWRASIQGSLGFVPTMGQLHAGHVALLEHARKENDNVILSIFVNPTQFNDPNDFARYPKNFEQDCEHAKRAGVDAMFYPDVELMYPDEYSYQISESSFSSILEGVSRPGHFAGMLTVVMKLLQIAQADRAYFGEKDYQQLKLVQGLVRAFFLKTEIIPCPIVRDSQGLALSSRHQRMSEAELAVAKQFSKIFLQAKTPEECTRALTSLGITIEYNEIHQDRWLIAVKIGHTRLIDNKLMNEIYCDLFSWA